MARLVDSRGGYLAGQDIRFDQAERTLEINGPGEAVRAGIRGRDGRAQPAAPSEGRHEDPLDRAACSCSFQQTEMPMPVSVIPLEHAGQDAVMERLNRQTIFEMRRPPAAPRR